MELLFYTTNSEIEELRTEATEIRRIIYITVETRITK
jgi:hypothetical protein